MFVTTVGDFFLPDKKLSPVRIALLYAVVGFVWILFSDATTCWLAQDLHFHRGEEGGEEAAGVVGGYQPPAAGGRLSCTRM